MGIPNRSAIESVIGPALRWSIGALAATAVVIAAAVQPSAAQPPFETVVAGLDNPHGLTVYGDALFVAEGGTGDQSPGQFTPGNGDGRVQLFSLLDLANPELWISGLTNAVDPSGGVIGANHAIRRNPGAATSTALVALSGGAGHPIPKAMVLVVTPGAQPFYFVDLWTFEAAHNPDGGDPNEGGIDSNPWRLVPGPDGFVYATDAGANDVLRFDPGAGDPTLYAVFEPVGVRGDGTSIQPVPTGLAFDPLAPGVAYVALLGSLVDGEAQIRRLEDLNGDGDALDGGENTLHADGLTAAVDLAFSPSDQLYIVEIFPGRVSFVRREGEIQTRVRPLVTGLFTPTAMAFLDNGDLLLTAFGGPADRLITDRVIRIAADLLEPGPPEPTATTPTGTSETPTATEPAKTPTATATDHFDPGTDTPTPPVDTPIPTQTNGIPTATEPVETPTITTTPTVTPTPGTPVATEPPTATATDDLGQVIYLPWVANDHRMTGG